MGVSLRISRATNSQQKQRKIEVFDVTTYEPNQVDARAVARLAELTRHAIAQQEHAVQAALNSALDDGAVEFGTDVDDDGRPYVSVYVDGFELLRVAFTDLVPLDDLL